MKHLKRRDNYLQQLNERRKLQSQIDSKHLNEAFKNEVLWGDSLLGKLVNWVIRKVGIGAKMVRMPLVINGLKEQFDRLISESSTKELSTDQQNEVSKVLISEILKQLANAVEEGEEVKVLIEMTTDVIEELSSLKVAEESEDKKKEIIEKLEKFLEFLKSLPTDSTESKTESETESETGEPKFSNSYTTIIKNLTALQLLLTNYKKVKLVDSSLAGVKEVIHIVKAGETLGSIQKNSAVNKQGLSVEQIIALNSEALKKTIESAAKMKATPDKLNLPTGLKLNLGKSGQGPSAKKESFIFEADVAYQTSQMKSQTGNPQAGQVSSSESHATQAFNKLLTALQVLENPKEKGFGITSDFVMDILNNKKEGKDNIKNLYKEILRFLIGDKKSTLNAPTDPLYKESFQIISDKNKAITVAEKIARFSKRAIQFDGENLYGSYGDLAKPLKDFVDSLKWLMKINPKELTEIKKESIVSGYQNYIKLIREAEETETTADKVKKYFNETLNIDDYLVEESEAKKIETDLEDNVGKTKVLVIKGMNPIIEIVRLFNRAYKLHTTPIIPVGTTDGKIKATTWAEYEAFGYTSGEPSATTDGPYRHRKTFNMWEDAVMDIFANSKYAPIFAVTTKLDDGSGNIKEGAGVALRQMMLDLLDGDELYKGDKEGGAQKRALNKYFGSVSEDYFKDEPKDSYLSFKNPDGKTDLEENVKNADSIKTLKMKFLSATQIATNESIKNNKFRGTIFSVTGKNSDGKIDNLYFFVYSGSGSNYFTLVSETLFDLKKILRAYQPSLELTKGDLANMDVMEKNTDGVIPVKVCLFPVTTLQKLKNGSLKSIRVKSVYKDSNDGKIKTSTYDLKEVKIPSFVVKEIDDKGSLELFKADDEKKVLDSLKGVKTLIPNIKVIETEKYGDKKDFKATVSEI